MNILLSLQTKLRVARETEVEDASLFGLVCLIEGKYGAQCCSSSIGSRLNISRLYS